jgi:hypothetical protein
MSSITADQITAHNSGGQRNRLDELAPPVLIYLMFVFCVRWSVCGSGSKTNQQHHKASTVFLALRLRLFLVAAVCAAVRVRVRINNYHRLPYKITLRKEYTISNDDNDVIFRREIKAVKRAVVKNVVTRLGADVFDHFYLFLNELLAQEKFVFIEFIDSE